MPPLGTAFGIKPHESSFEHVAIQQLNHLLLLLIRNPTAIRPGHNDAGTISGYRGRAHRLDHDFGESREASAAKRRHEHELNIFH